MAKTNAQSERKVVRVAWVMSFAVVVLTASFSYVAYGAGGAAARAILAAVLGVANIVIAPRFYRRWWSWVEQGDGATAKREGRVDG